MWENYCYIILDEESKFSKVRDKLNVGFKPYGEDGLSQK
jgi:hypothetical protein